MKLADELKQIINETWPDVFPVSKIGSGAYGVVFECEKRSPEADFSTKEAIKVMKIPYDYEDDYNDEYGVSPEEYFVMLKDRAVNEIKIMDELKSPHVVHINEYKVIQQKDQFGFFLLIRMDLLTNLKNVLTTKINDSVDENDRFVSKLCEDMLAALEVCFSHNTIHRDIKPENIFMSDLGEFYLGDFGLSRELSNRTRNVSSKGTELYMAPETYTKGCNELTDLYSLGLVLYKAANHNKDAFYDSRLGREAINEAQIKRLSGNFALPLPDNCSEWLGRIICKMCAYEPKERFQSIEEIRVAIKNKGINIGSASNTANTIVNNTNNRIVSVQNNVDNREINYQSINVNAVSFDKNAEVARTQSGNLIPQKKPQNKSAVVIALLTAGIMLLLLLCAVIGGKVLVYMLESKLVKEDSADSLNNTAYVSTVDTVVKDEVEIDTDTEENKEVHDSKKDVLSDILEDKEKDKPLSGFKIVESEAGEISTSAIGLQDTLGNDYDEAFCMNAYKGGAWGKFYLGNKYKSFVANMSCMDYREIGSNTNIMLSIYGDDMDKPIFQMKYSRACAVTPIEVDVTDVEFLTISITPVDDRYASTGIILSDAWLLVGE